MRKHIFGKKCGIKRIVAICVVAILLGSLVAPAFASDTSEESLEENLEDGFEADLEESSAQNQEEVQQEEAQQGENGQELTEDVEYEQEETGEETENGEASQEVSENPVEDENQESSEDSEQSESQELFVDSGDSEDSGQELQLEENEEYGEMSEELSEIAADSIQIASLSDSQEIALADDDETYGGKTISVSKTWRGDETTADNRPQAVTFELYASNSSDPVDTLTLTADNVTVSGGSTWKGTFDKKYPIYDSNGEKITYTVREASVTAADKTGNSITYKLDDDQTVTYPVYDAKGKLVESPTYRCVQNGDNTTTSDGYENVSAFVPVTELEEGVDYLVSSGNSGNVNIYRAEAYQTDNMIATSDGDVSAVSGGRTIEGLNSDGTTTSYKNYILVADDETGAAVGEDGKYLTDYMTWRAQYVNNNTGVLASNFYRLCGLVEEGDAGRYPGYMSTEKDKGYGLCVYKSNISSLSGAPAATQFTYDSTTGGFKTAGSDKVVYLYKKITLASGTLENQTQTVSMTNWKNSSSSGDKDPLDTGDQSEPEPYTDVTVSKAWADGEDHTGETVTVALYANGVEQKDITISADTKWKGVFASLPSQDSDGNDITYTVAEKSVKDSSGKTVSYISTVEDTTNPDTEKSKIWLPVDRPSKKSGGEDYIVIAFPSTKSEIGQNIWGDGTVTRKALTSNAAGTKFAMGSKNSDNTDKASMDVVVTTPKEPITVGGKTYTYYIADDQAKNSDDTPRTTIMWRVNYVGTASVAVASHADYGPWPRDLYSFQSLAGTGGYLSSQGAMTLEDSIDTTKFENNRSLFAYGMMYSSDWGEFNSMTKQGYTEDQITHMIGAMDHYALRSDKSPGKFGESDCTYPAMYLFKGVEVTNKSFVITNTSKKTVSVKKVWEDDENKDSKRPAKISVELFRNGVSTGKLLYLSESNNWEAVFNQLDKVDENEKEYEYTVKEHVSNQDSYETSYQTETDGNGNLVITITNVIKNTPVVVVMPETGSNDRISITLLGICLLTEGMLLMINTRKRGGVKEKKSKGQM